MHRLRKITFFTFLLIFACSFISWKNVSAGSFTDLKSDLIRNGEQENKEDGAHYRLSSSNNERSIIIDYQADDDCVRFSYDETFTENFFINGQNHSDSSHYVIYADWNSYTSSGLSLVLSCDSTKGENISTSKTWKLNTYKYGDSFGLISEYPEIPDFARSVETNLNTAISGWDTLLSNNLGYGLEELGFINYSGKAPNGSISDSSNCEHTIDNGTIIKNATCGNYGEKVYKCTKCHQVFYYEQIEPTGNHSYNNGTISKKATCGASGTKTYTCTKCGARKDAVIKASGQHNIFECTCKVCGYHSDPHTLYYNGFTCKYSSDYKTLTISGKGTVNNPDPKGYNRYNCLYLSSGTYKKVIKIIFQEGISGIGDLQLSNLPNLSTVVLPKSVTQIGEDAFWDCDNLKSINIPASVKTIGSGAFFDCKNLSTITLPNSVKTIGSGAFFDCKNLSTITLPNSVTSIGESAFDYCENLKTINIPSSVKTIGNAAFQYTAIEKIVIPNSIKSIPQSMFNDCKKLKSVSIPKSVTSIGDMAFAGCSSLKKITIPNSITKLGDCVFSDSGITSLTIPNSVKYIDECICSNCKKLTSVKLPSSMKEIPYMTFSGCTSLTSIKIPAGVTSIGQWAFDGCSKLKTITLPSKVKKIEKEAFRNCSNLKSITVKTTKLTAKTVEASAFKNVGKTNFKKVVVKVPASKLKLYKSIFVKKGLSKKAKIKK